MNAQNPSAYHIERKHHVQPRPALRLSNLSKTYPGSNRPAVDSLSIEVNEGEIVTLLGPSGCGKTTTLRMAAGLEVPDQGEISVGEMTVVMTSKGLCIPPNKRNVGMVFQSYAIWPHMTVFQNVAFPLKARNFPRSEMKDRVRRALELVGMSGYEKRPAPLLSGGQQQRVAFARALVTGPKLLLLDEPFSNLDAKLREQMRLHVKLLQRQLNIAILFVTHDQVEALSLSNRIVVMREGVVQQEGTPRSLYERPANEFVRDFIGTTLLFKGTVRSVNGSGYIPIVLSGAPNCVVEAQISELAAVRGGAEIFIAVRPEDVEVEPAQERDLPLGMILGIVETALFVGDRVEYRIKIDGQGSMLIYGRRRNPIDEGQKVWIKVRPEGHTAWTTNVILRGDEEPITNPN